MGVLWGLSLASTASGPMVDDDGDEAKGKGGAVDPAVVNAPATYATTAPAPGPTGFSAQARLGFTAGDQWEPAIAADAFGHVYVMYPQYNGVPGCPTCASPSMILVQSSDGGGTWSAPRIMSPAGGSQWDAQLAVDPADGRTLYAAWMENNKSDIIVARSDDFGATYVRSVADHTNQAVDKPILAARGNDVYVGYEHLQQAYVSSSHDRGATWSEVRINLNGKLGVSLAGGAAVDPFGRVVFGWDGYEQNGGAKGNVHLYTSSSTNGGQTWTIHELDVSASPPDCSAYQCGWAFLGAAMAVAADDGGTWYALWNAGAAARGAERIYFASSKDGGATWSAKSDVSTAPLGIEHAFPGIAAAAAGDVRIVWMDARRAPLWNVYTRRSSDGGTTWSAETDVSTYVSGYSYIQPDGFSFPFGDYLEIDIDGNGATHLVWGEGLNYETPGSIWYARSN
jgi:hypothetical protein